MNALRAGSLLVAVPSALAAILSAQSPTASETTATIDRITRTEFYNELREQRQGIAELAKELAELTAINREMLKATSLCVTHDDNAWARNQIVETQTRNLGDEVSMSVVGMKARLRLLQTKFGSVAKSGDNRGQ